VYIIIDIDLTATYSLIFIKNTKSGIISEKHGLDILFCNVFLKA
jgi:hypothetical protein